MHRLLMVFGTVLPLVLACGGGGGGDDGGPADGGGVDDATDGSSPDDGGMPSDGPPGMDGDVSDAPVPPTCDELDCGAGGRCVEDGSGARCECTMGWEPAGSGCAALGGWFPLGDSQLGPFEERLTSAGSGGGLSGNQTQQTVADVVVDGSGDTFVAFDAPVTVMRWDGSAFVEVGSFSGTHPTLALDGGGAPVLAWRQGGNLLLQRWDGAAWAGLASSGTGTGLGPMIETRPAIAVGAGGDLYVARAPLSSDITVSYWNGSSWEDVPGDAHLGISGGSVEALDLGLGAGDQPYVTWERESSTFATAHTVHVSTHDGSAWAGLGSAGTLDGIDGTGGDEEPVIMFDDTDAPIVVYGTPGGSDVDVGRWDGSEWTAVQTLSGTEPDLAVAPDGTRWLALGPPPGSASPSTHTWSGSRFDPAAEAPPPGVRAPSLAFDGTGAPVLAFVSSFSGNREAYVRRYDGSAWVGYDPLLDGRALSPGSRSVSTIDVATTPDGLPLIVHGSGTGTAVGSWRVRVGTFDGSAWSFPVLPDATTAIDPRPHVGAMSDGDIALFWAGISSGAGASGTKLLLGDGTDWTAHDGPPDPNLDSIMVVDASDRPIVARSSTEWPTRYLHVEAWNGTGFEAVGTPDPLHTGSDGTSDLASDDDDHLAVSFGSSIYFHDGSEWTELAGSEIGGATVVELGAATGHPVASRGGDVYIWDGTTWQDLGVPGDVVTDLAVADDGRIFAVWSAVGDGVTDIYLRTWDGTEWSEVEGSANGGGVSNSRARSADPSVLLLDDLVCVAWREPGDMVMKASLRCAHRP